MKKNLMLMTAAFMVLLTACGKETPVTEPQATTLPVEVQEGTVAYYKEEKIAPLVPDMKLHLEGVDYGKATLNINPFNFHEQSAADFIKAASASVKPEEIKNEQNEDFRFFGFGLESGGLIGFAEFAKNGELVTEYNADDLESYELKAFYTNSEMLSGREKYIYWGTSLFVGLSQDDITAINGGGYSSETEALGGNTFYYPDVNGYTLALHYDAGIPKSSEDAGNGAAPAETTAEAETTDAPQETETVVTDEPAVTQVLTELYYFHP